MGTRCRSCLLYTSAEVTEAQREEMRAFLAERPVRVTLADTAQIFYIEVAVFAGEHAAKVRICLLYASAHFVLHGKENL